MNKKIEKVLIDVGSFKKDNPANINGMLKKFMEADNIIFKETCQISYLNRCEPELCPFRILKKCKYESEYSRLKKIFD